MKTPPYSSFFPSTTALTPLVFSYACFLLLFLPCLSASSIVLSYFFVLSLLLPSTPLSISYSFSFSYSAFLVFLSPNPFLLLRALSSSSFYSSFFFLLFFSSSYSTFLLILSPNPLISYLPYLLLLLPSTTLYVSPTLSFYSFFYSIFYLF